MIKRTSHFVEEHVVVRQACEGAMSTPDPTRHSRPVLAVRNAPVRGRCSVPSERPTRIL